MPTPEQLTDAQHDEIGRRYGVDTRDPPYGRMSRRVALIVLVLVLPLSTVGLIYEALPTSIFQPYAPTSYLLWAVLGLFVPAVAAFLVFYRRFTDSIPVERNERSILRTQVLPGWPSWIRWIGQAEYAALASAAVVAGRPWLGVTICGFFSLATVLRLREWNESWRIIGTLADDEMSSADDEAGV